MNIILRGTTLIAATLTFAAGVIGLLSAGDLSQAAFPGANGSVFYSAEGSDSRYHIFVRGLEGGARMQLTFSSDLDDFSPAVSPDGTRVAFIRQDGFLTNDTAIWTMNADGTNAQIVPNTERAQDPYWTPDGNILFSLVFATGIFRIAPDGTGLTNLTPDLDRAEDPAASPDGSMIAFVVADNQETHLYVANADGSNARAITPPNGIQELDPDWSPDSQRITFGAIALSPVDSDVFVIDADGAGSANLTDDVPGMQSAPAFSPDGQRIVYAQTTAELLRAEGQNDADIPTQLFTMRTGGQDKVNFTQNSLFIEFDPDWGRAGPPPINGDTDCNGGVDAVDALQVLRDVAALPTSAGCIDQRGDTDCSGNVDAVDALRILRYVASLTNVFPGGCVPIGDPLPSNG